MNNGVHVRCRSTCRLKYKNTVFIRIHSCRSASQSLDFESAGLRRQIVIVSHVVVLEIEKLVASDSEEMSLGVGATKGKEPSRHCHWVVVLVSRVTVARFERKRYRDKYWTRACSTTHVQLFPFLKYLCYNEYELLLSTEESTEIAIPCAAAGHF